MLQPSNSEEPVGAESAENRVPKPGAEAAPELVIDPAWRAGKKLEEARLQRGLTIAELAARTRVRPEFLEALEAMNVKLLPGKAYAVAFLRSYAAALGLDPASIAEQFQAECALTREDPRKQIRTPESRPHPERPWLAAAGLLVLALGLFAWRAAETGAGKKPEVVATAQAPATQAPARLDPATYADRREIAIRALAPAWLEARGPDGTVFLSRDMAPGEIYRPDPSPGWTLHARDGSAFEIYVDGVSAGPLGPPGVPVLGRPIDGIEPALQAAN